MQTLDSAFPELFFFFLVQICWWLQDLQQLLLQKSLVSQNQKQ